MRKLATLEGRPIALQSFARWLPVVLLTASLALNLSLTAKLHAIKATAGQPSGPPLGSQLLEIAGETADGQSALVSMGRDHKPTVLYVFSPTCVWCARNLNNIRALVRLRSADFRFVGLSLSQSDKLGAHLRQSSPGMESIAIPDVAEATQLRLGATPETIVIGSNGTVQKNWIGAYSGATLGDIQSYFRVSLPGLQDASVDSSSSAHPTGNSMGTSRPPRP